MENRFGFRFYNAGKRISEMIKFSTTDSAAGQAEHGDGISSWPLDAPEKEWFFVPLEVKCGNETVRVNFKDDIKTKFGHRGVVLLDPYYDAANEDPEEDKTKYAVAATEEAAVARAEEIWNSYLLVVIERHLSDCDQALSAGGRPRKASGFTKYAFKTLGKVDPGDTYAHTENVKLAGDGGAVQAQLATLTALLLALASGQKLEPEAIKALLNITPAGETSGKPVTSGIATGKISKPIEGSDGWVKGEGNLDKGTLRAREGAKPKSDRTKEAVTAL